MVVYGVSVVGGDGQNRPGVDGQFDFIGRVVARPFASDKKGLLAKAQIGVSARYGDRDQKYVGYTMRRSGRQGYTLWGAGYTDSLKRPIHVIPSATQAAIGGELRLPIKMVELRAEAYYVANETREGVEGFQLTNTERLGQVKGLGWYVQLSAWPVGDAFVSGDPGFSPRPHEGRSDEGAREAEVGARGGGAPRGDQRDVRRRVPRGCVRREDAGRRGGPGTDLNVMQIGLAANYWYTKNVRLGVNYSAYLTPGSGSSENLLRVPGNTVTPANPDAHALHELGARVSMSF